MVTTEPAGVRLRDAGLAVAAAVSVWGVAAFAAEPDTEPDRLAGWVLGLLVGMLQLGRRHHPLGVLLASVALVVGYNVAGFPGIGLAWPLLLPYLGAAAAGHLGIAAGLAAALTATAVAWRVLLENELLLVVLVGEAQSLVVVGLALAVGEAAWQRSRWAEEARRRLAAAEADARRERDRRLLEQRLAVAADLHDMVGHSLVVIGLHLRIAEETAAEDPAACREAIGNAIDAHDTALRETATTVQLLRSGGATAGEGAPRHPAPDLSGLTGLVELAASAGVELVVENTAPPDLSAATALITYRICQESLTNTLKHANARHAGLRIDRRDDRLHLLFVDDGCGGSEPAAPHNGGHGIAGMTDRARSLGGDLSAGPRPGGGFHVEAWLPVHPPPPRGLR
jgi:signal transduction histidine kinase